MSRVAGVYFRLGGSPPFDKHPCVVVLEIEGSDECLVIPAFTAGREQVENTIEFYCDGGLDSSAVAVTFDNREAILWHRPEHAAERVHWVTIQMDKVDRSLFAGKSKSGTMKPAFMIEIYKSVIAYLESSHGNDRFSPHIAKKINKALRVLEDDHKKAEQ